MPPFLVKSDILCPKCNYGGGVTDLGLSPKNTGFVTPYFIPMMSPVAYNLSFRIHYLITPILPDTMQMPHLSLTDNLSRETIFVNHFDEQLVM